MHDGVLIEARESWRDSYHAVLCDIGAAAGVSEDEQGRKHYAERTLLRKLNTNRRVLIIGEGEYFGQRRRT